MGFSYEDYQKFAGQNQGQAQSNGNIVKVGFFKLKDDGDEALVRINCASASALQFAAVHTISTGGKWLKVSCLNPFGTGAPCPLCAAAANNTTISKTSQKVYLQLIVSYKDKQTGGWSAPVPVIWERPASWSREIATKIANYGDLREHIFKITRNGKAGDMKTTYSLDYAVPTVFKPEMVPADFGPFANFKIERHSYYDKSRDDIITFLNTGAFPEAMNTSSNVTTNTTKTTAYDIPVQQVSQQQPMTPPPTVSMPTADPTAEVMTERPARNFSGFSF